MDRASLCSSVNLRDCEAEACALARPGRASRETLEEAAHEIGRDAGSAIFAGDHQLFARPGRGKRDRWRAVSYCVYEQIGDDPVERMRIDNGAQTRFDLNAHALVKSGDH